MRASERNHRAQLKLLFHATAATLLQFGRRSLPGQVGFTLVLHTWDQQLRTRLHLHELMTAGAVAPDGSRWIPGGRKFLFPVHGPPKMFRAKFLDGLAKRNDEPIKRYYTPMAYRPEPDDPGKGRRMRITLYFVSGYVRAICATIQEIRVGNHDQAFSKAEFFRLSPPVGPAPPAVTIEAGRIEIGG
ncbi:MAG: transposase [Planctomycetes bacterium]|nr:transposase [Planctomycetota bacterium]